MRATASALLLSLLYTAPAAAQVSATASPVSNSSGSVVNQAVQITPGQYMKHIGKEVFRVLFVDDDNTKASQLAEAIGNSLREPNFVFMSAGVRSKKINAKAAGFLESKGHDIGNNISKSVENIPNLDHYQVII